MQAHLTVIRFHGKTERPAAKTHWLVCLFTRVTHLQKERKEKGDLTLRGRENNGTNNLHLPQISANVCEGVSVPDKHSRYFEFTSSRWDLRLIGYFQDVSPSCVLVRATLWAGQLITLQVSIYQLPSSSSCTQGHRGCWSLSQLSQGEGGVTPTNCHFVTGPHGETNHN